jgi:Fic family protein
VLGNIDAMASTVQSLGAGDPITVERILDFHRRLLVGTRLDEYADRTRTKQNWIGGRDYNPCSAEYVPPPPELVDNLLADLCAFCNDDSLPAVVQAALAHAQFETIHPFADGNGRTGRALIHLILRRRGLAQHVLLPVSLILATWARDYVEGLTATRYRGPATSKQARDGINLWVGRFAGACRRAVDDALSFEARAQEINTQWRRQLGTIRAKSATDLLLSALIGAPVLTVNSAAALIGRSFPQTNVAIQRLAEAGILAQVNVGRRNRAFEAADVIGGFMDLERQLASPVGDTIEAPPSRRVPRKR